jgi:hypothetical protein
VPPLIADNAILSGLWVYWDAKRGAQAMPRWRDIDPGEMPPRLLPHLQLVERVGGRFRYRLTGTAIVDAYARELTGLFVDEVLPPQRREVAERHYALVYDKRQPIFVRNQYTTASSVDLVVSRIVLPLSDDGTAVSLLLMAQTFEYSTEFTARLGMDSAIDPRFDQVELLPAA